VEKFEFGDALLVVGLAMLAFSLFLAFLQYVQLSQSPQISTSIQSNVSAANAVSILINNLSQTLNSESYVLIKIVIFFFIANVGFKFAKLGMEMNKDKAAEEEQPKKASKGLANPY
jgi:hypothetical protein